MNWKQPAFRNLIVPRLSLGRAAVCILPFLLSTSFARADDPVVVPSSTAGTGVFNEGYVPTVTVDPASGVAHVAFPFSLPAARGAAQPSLSLIYSSDAGTRTAGAGWGLDLPVIERRPLSNPASGLGDRYAISGAAIVQICTVHIALSPQCNAAPKENMPGWADGWNYYRNQVEGNFARIFHSPDGKTWRVELKNGVTMEFGAPWSDIPYPSGVSPAIDGDSSYGNFRWDLIRQFDTQAANSQPPGRRGPPHPGARTNVITYEWGLLSGHLGLHYLTDVYDTLGPGQNAGQHDGYAHHVNLAYQAHAFVDFSDAPIWHAVPDLRLSQIDVTSANFSGTGPRELVRRYSLKYMTIVHASYLTSIQQQGRCSAPLLEPLPASLSCPLLPPTTFNYTQATAGPVGPIPVSINYGSYSTSNNPPGVTPNPSVNGPNSPLYDVANLAILDVDHDGLPDIVESFGSKIPSTVAGAPAPLLNIYLNQYTVGPPIFNYATMNAFSLANYLGGGSTNTFLTAASGVSILGYWGNVDRASVLSSNPHNPNSAGAFYYVAGPIRGAAFAPSWGGWDVLGGFAGPPIYAVADIEGDGLLDAIDTTGNIWFSAKDLSNPPNYIRPFQIQLGNPVPVPRGSPSTTWFLDNGPVSPLFAFADMNGDGLPGIISTFVLGEGPGGDPNNYEELYLYTPNNGTGFGCHICNGPQAQATCPFTPDSGGLV